MKRTATIFGIAALTTLAAGCGGSGGGGGDDSTDTTFDFSGQAIDGYLSNAQVCIDVNYNSRCDDDEPSTTTGSSQGRFTISGIDDASRNAPTLVRAIGGQTVDSDSPGSPIGDDFNLTAPSSARVVTPLTTLVQARASQNIASGDDVDAAVDSAKQAIQDLLGSSGREIDILNDDYVSARGASDSDRATAATRISATARAVNRLIQETSQRTRDSLSESDETNLNSNGTLNTVILNTVSRKVTDKLSDISRDVSSAINDSSDDIEAAADTAADNNPADEPTLNELSQEVEDIETVEDETVEDEDATGATGGSGS